MLTQAVMQAAHELTDDGADTHPEYLRAVAELVKDRKVADHVGA